MSPSYISSLVKIRSCSAYSLRSNNAVLLELPKGRMLTTLGARSLWNSLPSDIREIKSLGAFKNHLETRRF